MFNTFCKSLGYIVKSKLDFLTSGLGIVRHYEVGLMFGIVIVLVIVMSSPFYTRIPCTTIDKKMMLLGSKSAMLNMKCPTKDSLCRSHVSKEYENAAFTTKLYYRLCQGFHDCEKFRYLRFEKNIRRCTLDNLRVRSKKCRECFDRHFVSPDNIGNLSGCIE